MRVTRVMRAPHSPHTPCWLHAHTTHAYAQAPKATQGASSETSRHSSLVASFPLFPISSPASFHACITSPPPPTSIHPFTPPTAAPSMEAIKAELARKKKEKEAAAAANGTSIHPKPPTQSHPNPNPPHPISTPPNPPTPHPTGGGGEGTTTTKFFRRGDLMKQEAAQRAAEQAQRDREKEEARQRRIEEEAEELGKRRR